MITIKSKPYSMAKNNNKLDKLYFSNLEENIEFLYQEPTTVQANNGLESIQLEPKNEQLTTDALDLMLGFAKKYISFVGICVLSLYALAIPQMAVTVEAAPTTCNGFGSSSANWALDPAWVTTANGIEMKTDGVNAVSAKKPLANMPTTGTIPLTMTVKASNSNDTDGLTTGAISYYLDGTLYATITNPAGPGNVTVQYFNGATGNWPAAGVDPNPPTNQTFTLNVPATSSKNRVLDIRATASNVAGQDVGQSGGDNFLLSDFSVPVNCGEITKIFSPSAIKPGEVSTLTFDIANSAGTPSNSNLSFTDNLPAGLTVINPSAITNSCKGTIDASSGASSIALTGGSFVNNQTNCVITVQVKANAEGSYTNGAANLTNLNGVSAPTNPASLTVRKESLDLSVTKTLNNPSAVIGDALTYTITVRNGGLSTVSGAVLKDTMPALLTNQSVVSCVGCTNPLPTMAELGAGYTVAPIAPGAEVSYVIKGTVPAGTAAGTLFANTATVTPPGTITDPFPANNTATANYNANTFAPLNCNANYATTFTPTATTTQVQRYDPATNTMVNTGITLPGRTRASALSPDGKIISYYDDIDQRMEFYNISTNTYSSGPAGVVKTDIMTRLGYNQLGEAYTMLTEGGVTTVYKLDPATNKLVSQGALSDKAWNAAYIGYIAGGDIIFDKYNSGYLVDNNGYFFKFDLATMKATYLGFVPGISSPAGLSFAPDGSILAFSSTTGAVSKIELADFKVTNLIPAGGTMADSFSCSFPDISPKPTALKNSFVVKDAYSNGLGGTPTPADGKTLSPGDIVEYKVVLRNGGITSMTNSKFQDTLPAGVTYVPYSATMNGYANYATTFPYATPTPVNSPGAEAGIVTADTTPSVINEEVVITYRVKIDNPFALNPKEITNKATFTSDDTVVATTSLTNPILDSKIELYKGSKVLDSNSNNKTDVGDKIKYNFTVKNIGNTDLKTVTLSDNICSPIIGGPIALLLAGDQDTTTFSCLYTITQADVDAGKVVNTATVNGVDPSGKSVLDSSDDLNDPTKPSNNDPTITPILSNPSIELFKKSTLVGTGKLGDKINYAFTVKNTGDVTLTGVTITDSKCSPIVGAPIASLAVGATNSTNFTCSYTITAADVAAGTVENTATVTAKDPTGKNVLDTSDDLNDPTKPATNDPTITVLPPPPAPAPAIELFKKSTVVGTKVGDKINYTFGLKNSGTTVLTGVAITDTKCSPVVGGPIASFAVGAIDSTTFTCSYTITQADVDAGKVENTATVTAKSPTGAVVTDISDDLNDPSKTGTSDPTISLLPKGPTADLQITKSVDKLNPAIGTYPTYTLTIKNNGPNDVPSSTITDTLPAGLLFYSATPAATTTTGQTRTWNTGPIKNGETKTITYIAYVNAQTPQTNTAKVTSPIEDPIPENNASVVTINSAQVPTSDVSITKSVTPPTAKVGDTVTYTITVKNDGPDAASNVNVSDVMPSGITAGTASPTASSKPVNYITNGDFEAGNSGFGYNYNLVPTSPTQCQSDFYTGTVSIMDGSHCVLHALGAYWAVKSDHTTPGTSAGNYLFVQGGLNSVPANQTVWEQTVTGLTPGKQYKFCYWAHDAVMNWNVPSSWPGGATSIDGATTQSQNPFPYLTTSVDANWVQYCSTYTADADGASNIKINNLNTSPIFSGQHGNDWVIDDITLEPVVTTGTEYWALGTVAKGETKTITYTGVVKEGGDQTNKAAVTTTTDPATKGANNFATATVSAPAALPGKIELFKKSTLVGAGVVGDKINYNFTVKNTGPVVLTNVKVTDNKCTVIGGPIATLAVGATDSTTFTCSYTLTQADIDAGKVVNTAAVSGTDPSGKIVLDTSDDLNIPATPGLDDPTTTPIPQNGKIELLKKSTLVGTGKAGDKINYTFTVKNTGTVTLTGVKVTDNKCTVLGGPIASLAVGASDTTTFTCSYTLTQADVDAGKVENTATVTAKDPTGKDVTDTSDDLNDPTKPGAADPTVTPLPQAGKIELTKKSTLVGAGVVGDKINYTFTVKNTGAVTLTNATLNDTKCSPIVGGPIPTLAVGATDTTTFKCTYTLIQEDIDAGIVTNTATVTAKDPTGKDVTDNSDDLNDPTKPGLEDPTVTPIPQTGKIELLKKSTVVGTGLVGDKINYTFTVKNTGTVTLFGATLTDTKCSPIVGGPIATLAVGATDTTTFTCSYTITQADVDAGKVENTATVNAKDKNGKVVTDISDDLNDPTKPGAADPTITPIVANGKIELFKKSTLVGAGGVGDKINYNFTVKNTGPVTLTNVKVTDNKCAVVGGPIATLAVGATDSTTFTCSYTLTQADIDAGKVVNTAAVSGTDPKGKVVLDTSDDLNIPATPGLDDPTTTPLPQNGKIELLKKSALVGTGKAGDKINYTFTVKNTGTVTLTAVKVTDSKCAVLGGPIATLAPGASDTTTFTCAYTLTQADVDAGKVENTATVTGKDPTGKDITDTSDDLNNPATPGAADPTITPLPQVGKIELLKKSTLVGTGKVGDKVNYTFTVKNTGPVTLTNATITDTKCSPIVGGPIATLAPGATDTTTFTCSYTITQADVDAGKVENTATVTAKDPTGKDVTDKSDDLNDPSKPGLEDPTITPIPQIGKIELLKKSTLVGGGSVGDKINYNFTVKNTGTVTLTNVKVTDNKCTIVGGPIATLAVGASDATTFTCSYTLTQADIDAGKVVNTATTTGTDPKGVSVTDISDDINVPSTPGLDDPTTTPLPQTGKIELFKKSALVGTGKAGDKINYTFTVKNIGNVTLTNATITDTKCSPVTGGPIATLLPGATDSTSLKCTYTLTQADVDAGKVENTATVVAKDPTGKDVIDKSDDLNNPATLGPEDPTVTLLPQVGKIELLKKSTLVGTGKVGDKVNYTFTVKNTGPVTLTNITLNDTKCSPIIGGPIPTLAVGATDTTTFTCTYTLIQGDIDAGVVTNTATVTGKDPSGKDVVDNSDDLNDPTKPGIEDPTVTPIPQVGKIELQKKSTLVGPGAVGDKINYTFTVKNTGTLTLKDVKITDTKCSPINGGPIATLAVGATDTTTFTCSYALTQADIDAGKVENTATVTAKDPLGKDVTDKSDDLNDPTKPGAEDPTITPIPRPGKVELFKKSTLVGQGFVGDKINYTFTVKNTGPVTLTDVKITDNKCSPIVGGPIATLAVGATDTTTFTCSYTLTQADVDAGKVDNTATVTAKDPAGTTTTDKSDDLNVPATPGLDDPTTTIIPLISKIEVLKKSALVGTGVVGDKINYTFTVKNTGNVSLTNVTLTDNKCAPVFGGPIPTLAPGASDTTTFKCTYELTQVDIDAGKVVNSAIVSGTDPKGKVILDTSDDLNIPATPGLDDPTVTPLPQTGKIELLKKSTLVGTGVVGDKINYAFTVKNTGTVTLTNVTITDTKCSPILGGPIATLAVGATNSTTFTCVYTLTQADIDAGKVENTATTTAKDPTGKDVTDKSDDQNDPTKPGLEDPTITPIPQNGKIELLKKSALVGTGVAGDKINYTFTVKNTGAVTLKDVKVTDTKCTVIGGPIATLAVGGTDSTTFTCSYTLTQADVDAGKVENTATVTAKDPSGKDVIDKSDDLNNPQTPGAEDPTITPIPQNGKLELLKKSTLVGTGVVGDKINYTFTVKNTGAVTLTNVTLTDSKCSPIIGGPIPSLAVGVTDTTTFKCSYDLTQADIDAGKVTNTATVSGTTPDGKVVTDTSDDLNNPATPGAADPTITPLPQTGKIELFKKSALVGTGVVGDKINYTFTVKNIGNVTLTAVTITDTKCSPIIGGPIATLLVGDTDSTTFKCSYTLTQADIDAGKVENTATTIAKDPTGKDVIDKSDDLNNPATPGPEDPTITPIPQNGKIELLKKSTFLGTGLAGDKINYSFTVKNTGAVTLKDVKVTDTKCTVLGGPIPTLAPGASDTTTFTCSYTLTQADVDAGKVENTATVIGKDPSGKDVTDKSDDLNDPTKPGLEDPTVTPIPQNGKIELQKKSALVGTGVVGDKINYTFTVKNTGGVTLTNVTLKDDKCAPIIGGPIPLLSVGALDTKTFTCVYTLIQSDIDAGKVVNTATVSGVDPKGKIVTDISDDLNNPATPGLEDPTVTPLPQVGKIELLKKSALVGTGIAGDKINYTFTVKNTGNVTLTAVKLTDSKCSPINGGPIATLNVGDTDSTTFTCSYTLTQADVDAGKVENTATITAKDPTGKDVTDKSDDLNNPATPGLEDPTITPIPQNGKIELLKKSALVGTGVVGDKINYTFTVKNTGGVTLKDVTVTDTKCSPIVGGPIATLAPGASDATTFTCSYTLTQADVDAGKVENTATVNAKDPTGKVVTDKSDDLNDPTKPGAEDPTITPIPQNGKIEVLKKSTLVGTGIVGDKINYTFTVKNTGAVTLSSVTIDDSKCSVQGTPIAKLAPGASDTATFTCSYVLTQSDIDAGKVENSALVKATDPSGKLVTDKSDDLNDPTKPGLEDPTVTPLPQTGKIELLKKSTLVGTGMVGDKINYTFTVKNTGNITLTNVKVTDNKCTVLGGPIATLAPAATDSTTFTCSYTLTQADVDAGKVENTATVTAKDPTGKDVTDKSDDLNNPSTPGLEDPTITPIPQNGKIELLKKSALVGTGVAGDKINYTFTVKNTGAVTLKDVKITDTKCSPINGGPIATLAPGALDTTTFTCSYTLTQADVDAGKVENTATVTAKDPAGKDVTDKSDDLNDPTKPGLEDPTVTPIPQNGKLELLKKSSMTGTGIIGDKINYTFTVKNTGAVTLTNVTIKDDKCAPVKGGPILTLAPGATDTTTFTCSYDITQVDIDAGKVVNTATVSGTTPAGKVIVDTSDDLNNPATPGLDDPTTTPLPQSGKIELLKKSALVGTGAAGDKINYTFTVKNTGNVTLKDVKLTDSKCSPINGGPIASMAVGAIDATTFTCSYTLTQADVDAGKVENTATITATDPTGKAVTDVSDDLNNPQTPGAADPTITPIPQNGKIELLKKSTLVGLGAAGDKINYTFTVKNTGPVTLNTVTLTDTKCSPIVGGPIATLAVGATDTTTFTCSYTLTQADVDAGKVENTATITATDPKGVAVTDVSDDLNNPATQGSADPTITPIPQNGKIELLKKSTLVGLGAAGDKINYTFTVKNTGPVTLNTVTLTDTKCSPIVGGPIATLAVGATDTTTFTCSYTLTQADVDAGKVENTATVNAKDPSGKVVTDKSDDLNDPTKPGAEDPTITPIPQNSKIEVLKKSALVGTGIVGDKINYTFTVKNTGAVTLSSVTIDDSKCSVQGGPIAKLAPGATDTTTFTCSYVLTQSDIDAGKVENSALVKATDPSGKLVTDKSDDLNDPTKPGLEDPTITPLPQTGKIELLKKSTLVGTGMVGDKINYTFTVKNTGNITLTNVKVTDNKCTVLGGPIATLAPAATDSTTFTCSYILTQADVDAGKVENTATVTAKDPTGKDVTDTSDDLNDPTKPGLADPTITPIPQNGKIELLKKSALVGTGVVGDKINYTFTVKNTGAVTLKDVKITDTKCTVVGGPIATLAPGASDTTTFTCSYTLTQADIDAGKVENTATVTAKDPTGKDVTDKSDDLNDPTKPGLEDPTITPIPQNGKLELLKKSSMTGTGIIGDKINYTFTVKNTGAVTLTNVTIKDDKCAPVKGGPILSLAVGATDTTTFSCSYELTQVDIDAGKVVNTATVSGTTPAGKVIVDTSDDLNNPATPGLDDPTTTPLPQAGKIELLKKSALVGTGAAGDKINYTFTVKNTGKDRKSVV